MKQEFKNQTSVFVYVKHLSYIALYNPYLHDNLPKEETNYQGKVKRFVISVSDLSTNLKLINHFNFIRHYAESFVNQTPKSHNPIDIHFNLRNEPATKEDCTKFMSDYLTALRGVKLQSDTMLYISTTNL